MLALIVGSELASTIAFVAGIVSTGEVGAWEVLYRPLIILGVIAG